MKRTYTYAARIGEVRCAFPDGSSIVLPVFPAILKHPPSGELARLLERPEAAVKYTREALRSAPWQILREFPRDWLLAQMAGANLRHERRQALEFVLGRR